MPLSRRDLFRTVPIAAVAAGISGGFHSRLARAGDGLIVRMQEPRNLETPLRDLTGGITRTEKFFVRSHFAVPTIDPKTFTLSVEGHVEKKLELTLDDLKKMEAVSREITLECAGNGRVFLVPQARGLQWGHGAVGNAKWSGVPLGAILERAKVKAGAADVVLVGADSGSIAEPATPGAIHFDRGIPLAKAKKDETLLAWNMNDEPLTPSHGFPLRAIVGGWYGMASVKWLTKIVVTDKPHAGFWQTFDYSIWDRNGPSPQLVPVTAMQPKAVITTWGPGEVIAPGRQKFHIAAWAGENAVKSVAFSIDGGKTWLPPYPVADAKPFTWVSAQGEMELGNEAGMISLAVRCTDDKGNTQPDKRDPDRRTYMINHVVPTEVTVKGKN